MESKSTKLYILIFLFFVVMASLVTGCSSNKIGKLVSFEASFTSSDIQEDGSLSKLNFSGIVIVELDDGTRVRAIWDNSLGDQVTGGMELEIAPTDDPELWKVIRIVETP